MSNMRTVKLALDEAERAVARAKLAVAEMLGESATPEAAPVRAPTRRAKAAEEKSSKSTKKPSIPAKTATAGKSNPKTSNGAKLTVAQAMPKILRVLDLQVGSSRQEIASLIGLVEGDKRVYAFDKALSKLKDRGDVRMEGERRGARYFLVKALASAPAAESPASAN